MGRIIHPPRVRVFRNDTPTRWRCSVIKSDTGRVLRFWWVGPLFVTLTTRR